MVIDEDSKDFIAVSDRRDALEKPGCQILEFVFGRSIATNLLEEIRIVFKNGSWNTQSSPINPVGNSRFDLKPVQVDITLRKGPAERR